jgi:hypothetical protein
MSDGETPSLLEIREITDRALLIQRFLLRRAWGVLYAALSISMFATVFGTPIAALLGVSGLAIVPLVIVHMLPSGAAVIVILLAFRRIRDTAEIHSIVTVSKWNRVLGYRYIVSIWVAIYGIVFASIVFSGAIPGLLLLSIYVAVWGYFYYALRLSFPNRLPSEGIAALSSLGIAAVGSIITLLFFPEIRSIIGILWGANILVWVTAAVYARALRPRDAVGESLP